MQWQSLDVRARSPSPQGSQVPCWSSLAVTWTSSPSFSCAYPPYQRQQGRGSGGRDSEGPGTWISTNPGTAGLCLVGDDQETSQAHGLEWKGGLSHVHAPHHGFATSSW